MAFDNSFATNDRISQSTDRSATPVLNLLSLSTQGSFEPGNYRGGTAEQYLPNLSLVQSEGSLMAASATSRAGSADSQQFMSPGDQNSAFAQTGYMLNLLGNNSLSSAGTDASTPTPQMTDSAAANSSGGSNPFQAVMNEFTQLLQPYEQMEAIDNGQNPSSS